MDFYERNGLPSAAHLELTDRCNAACPLCSRTSKVDGRPTVFVKHKDLSPRVIRSRFHKGFIAETLLRYVHLCGNYGDPIVHPHVFQIAAHFLGLDVGVGIATNGSLRDHIFWTRLGQLFSFHKNTAKVTFGIDGTDAVTHETYRKFTSFDKIIHNARAFIAAGGFAQWQFIVFDHNEHQVEKARQMAKELGFRRFRLVIGNRIKAKRKAARGITDVDSAVHQHRSTVITDRMQRSLRYGVTLTKRLAEATLKAKEYTPQTTVESQIPCRTKEEGSFFVSAEGFVFPCCWTALHYNRLRHAHYPGVEEVANMTPTTPNYTWGPELNIYHSKVEAIVRSDFFHNINALLQPGEKNPLWPCYKTCYLKANKEILEQSRLK